MLKLEETLAHERIFGIISGKGISMIRINFSESMILFRAANSNRDQLKKNELGCQINKI